MSTPGSQSELAVIQRVSRGEMKRVGTIKGNMKLGKATAIVFFLAMGAALIVLSANAQSPSAAPTAKIARFILSEKPPQYWTAEGGTQGQWMALRQRCADIGAELTRRHSMSDKQLQTAPGLSFSRDEMLLCSQLLPSANTTSRPALPPSTASPAIIPTPMNTPSSPGASGRARIFCA